MATILANLATSRIPVTIGYINETRLSIFIVMLSLKSIFNCSNTDVTVFIYNFEFSMVSIYKKNYIIFEL